MDLHFLFSNTWYVFLIVVFFGGSIFVHELGHFLAARKRGVHVERFSIGFGPAIWTWRGKDGVEYRISWLPLGGYVALPQLADMSGIEGASQTDVAKLPPPSFTTKVLVFSAGAFFNILFAFSLACILWIIGLPESKESNSTQLGYVFTAGKTLDPSLKVSTAASNAGLRAGDIIESIDGKSVNSWSDIVAAISLGSGVDDSGKRIAHIAARRLGELKQFTVYPELMGPEKDRKIGIAPGAPLTIGSVKSGSLADRWGFKVGDELESIDGIQVLHSMTLQELLEAPAPPAEAIVKRAGASLALPFPKVSEKRDAQTFGIEIAPNVVMVHTSPFVQIYEHALVPFQTLQSLFSRHSDVGLNKLSGPIGIIRIFYSAAEAGMRQLLWFTILINVSLALFNLLPIPVLDGGHILFATIAKLRGRNLPFEFIATTQSVFMVLLFSLILYVSFFDSKRWVRDRSEIAAPAATPAKP